MLQEVEDYQTLLMDVLNVAMGEQLYWCDEITVTKLCTEWQTWREHHKSRFDKASETARKEEEILGAARSEMEEARSAMVKKCTAPCKNSTCDTMRKLYLAKEENLETK